MAGVGNRFICSFIPSRSHKGFRSGASMQTGPISPEAEVLPLMTQSGPQSGCKRGGVLQGSQGSLVMGDAPEDPHTPRGCHS